MYLRNLLSSYEISFDKIDISLLGLVDMLGLFHVLGKVRWPFIKVLKKEKT